MMLRFILPIIFVLSTSWEASACDWASQSIKTSEFVDGKTIFWGRAIELKWDRKINVKSSEESPGLPDTYHVVEVIKPLRGKTKKKVKVWTDNTTCGYWFQLGSVQLYITEAHGKNDLHTDQLLMYRAGHPAIVAFLEEGVDVETNGHIGIRRFEPPDQTEVDEVMKQISEIYERERKDVVTLSQKEPWWKFSQKPSK